jgi:hypothetical protein
MFFCTGPLLKYQWKAGSISVKIFTGMAAFHLFKDRGCGDKPRLRFFWPPFLSMKWGNTEELIVMLRNPRRTYL